MVQMKPLEEWICDTCGQKLSANNGWLEWLSPRSGPHSFNIVHNKRACYQHDHHPDRSDMHLHVFLGANGLQQFLSMMDLGKILDPSGMYMPALPEMRSFVDTIRRLHIPHYEEARQYISEAVADGYFSDQNEVSIFLPNTCLSIIKRYGNN